MSSRSLKCDLCSEFYVDPRLLQCLHSFCSKCLTKLQQETGTLNCPSCKKKVKFPKEGVDALPKDIRKGHEAEFFKIENKIKNESEISCDKCSKLSSRSTVAFCITCCEFLCKACKKQCKTCDHKLKPVEKWSKQAAKPLPDISPIKPVNCILHTDKPFTAYCETCSLLICQKCIIKEHKDHTYHPIDEKVSEREKNALSLKLQEAFSDDVRAKLDDTITKKDENIQQVQNEQASVEEAIESAFKILSETLQSRKECLIDKAAEIGRRKLTPMTTQCEELKTLRDDFVEASVFCRAAIQVYQPAEMLSVKGVMTTRLQQLSKRLQRAKFESCSHTTMPHNLDASELVKQVNSFGAIGSCPAKAVACLYIPRAIVGKPKKITILTHDEQGHRFPHGGEKVEVSLCSPVGSADPPLNATVQDIKDGTYVATITPQMCGKHEVNITIEEKTAKKLSLYVRQKRDYAQVANCKSVCNAADPCAIAVDDSGEVYIAQYSKHCVVVFSQTQQTIIHTIGISGSAGNEDGPVSYTHLTLPTILRV